MKMNIAHVKICNKKFFTKRNKDFFNDRSYRILKGKKSKGYFFIQESPMVIGDASGLPSYFIIKSMPLVSSLDVGTSKTISIEDSLEAVHKKMKSL